MSNSADKCILCLSEISQFEEIVDYNVEDLCYVFPELDITNMRAPFRICFICSNRLHVFSQFKKKSMTSIHRRRQYIKILRESGDAQNQNFGDIKIELSHSPINVKEQVDVSSIFNTIFNTNEVQQYSLEYDVNIKEDILTEEEDTIPTFKYEDSSICRGTDLKCAVCNKIFLMKSDLEKHATVHKGVKKFECAICNKLFSHKCSLQKHMTIHTDMKIECAICKKAFTCRSKLTRHIRTVHSASKRFECSICNKRFKLFEYLKNHMLTHEKKIECSICDKKFSRNTNYIAHMSVHTGMQNYECSICHQKFSMKHHLLTHAVRHTGLKFECSICNKQYTTKFYLAKHKATHKSSK